MIPFFLTQQNTATTEFCTATGLREASYLSSSRGNFASVDPPSRLDDICLTRHDLKPRQVLHDSISRMDQTNCFGCGRGLEQTDRFQRLSQLCEPCLNSLVFASGISPSVYLESRSHPSALLARDHTVLFANSLFRALRLDQKVVGLRVGEVIGCLYAPTLGRCRETEVCILCSLRRAVDQTWRTGEGLRGIPMNYPHKTVGRKAVEITTEKIGDAVLVIMADHIPS